MKGFENKLSVGSSVCVGFKLNEDGLSVLPVLLYISL